MTRSISRAETRALTTMSVVLGGIGATLAIFSPISAMDRWFVVIAPSSAPWVLYLAWRLFLVVLAWIEAGAALDTEERNRSAGLVRCARGGWHHPQTGQCSLGGYHPTSDGPLTPPPRTGTASVKPGQKTPGSEV